MTVRQLARLLQPYDQRCQHASCASPVTGESNFDDGEEGSEVGEEGEEGSEVGEEGEEEGDEVRRLHARPLFPLSRPDWLVLHTREPVVTN